MQLDEIGEQALHVVERRWPRWMTRDLHALPGREVAIQIAAHHVDAPFETCNFAIALLARRKRGQGFDLFQ
jgi:hypothetical protein